MPSEGAVRIDHDYANDREMFRIFRRGEWRVPTEEERHQLTVWRCFTKEAADRALARQKAETRARALLLSKLSPDQRKQLETHRWFETTGGASGRTYRIHASNGRNVTWVKDGKNQISYCAYPAWWSSGINTEVPLSDVMLAQKLAIEDPTMEPQFINMACKERHNPIAQDAILPAMMRVRIAIDVAVGVFLAGGAIAILWMLLKLLVG